LFDYPARNDGRSSSRSTIIVVEVKRFRLVGESTASIWGQRQPAHSADHPRRVG
jgi:hypothetical protein